MKRLVSVIETTLSLGMSLDIAKELEEQLTDSTIEFVVLHSESGRLQLLDNVRALDSNFILLKKLAPKIDPKNPFFNLRLKFIHKDGVNRSEIMEDPLNWPENESIPSDIGPFTPDLTPLAYQKALENPIFVFPQKHILKRSFEQILENSQSPDEALLALRRFPTYLKLKLPQEEKTMKNLLELQFRQFLENFWLEVFVFEAKFTPLTVKLKVYLAISNSFQGINASSDYFIQASKRLKMLILQRCAFEELLLLNMESNNSHLTKIELLSDRILDEEMTQLEQKAAYVEDFKEFAKKNYPRKNNTSIFNGNFTSISISGQVQIRQI